MGVSEDAGGHPPGAGQHVVQGHRVALPVRVRDASAFLGVYSVPARAAQEVIDYSDLEVLQHRAGKALCCLLFVRYEDGDLGRYHEFGVSFFVRPPGGSGGPGGSGARSGPGGSGARSCRDLAHLVRGHAGVFIHRLPVDGEFTCEAGRSIWGFPKVVTDIDLLERERQRRAVLRFGGEPAVDLRVGGGVPVPGGGVATSLDAYTRFGGITRRVPWRMRASGTRFRPGGAELRLGEHEVASELAGLGLPRRALMSSSIGELRMSFGAAEEVGTAG